MGNRMTAVDETSTTESHGLNKEVRKFGVGLVGELLP